MSRVSAKHQSLVAFLAFATAWAAPARAGTDVFASKSITVQPNGPREGEVGSNYFNIEGKNKERYASFGVLIIEHPKGDPQATVKELTITLVQSIPGFASDGKLKFYIGEPLDQPIPTGRADAKPATTFEKLKFDPAAPGGLAKDVYKSLRPLGSGVFKKVKTGQIDTFNLTPDEEGRSYVGQLSKAGGVIHIVVVPDDDNVAATYYGAGTPIEANRPRIKLGGESAK